MNEVARLRAELFDMASRESGAPTRAGGSGSESKDGKKKQDREADRRYEVLKAEYDRVLEENSALKAKLSGSSKKEQGKARPESSPARAKTLQRAAPARSTAAAKPAVSAKAAAPDEQNTAGAEAIRLMREGKTAEARSLLDAELKKLPDDPGLLYLYGMVYCREGDFANAVKVLKHVVDADQSNARARVALGGAYLAQRDYVNARMELEMAVGFDPDLAEAHYDLAQVLLVGTPSDPEAAKERYDEALRLGSRPDPAFEARLSRVLGKPAAAQGN